MEGLFTFIIITLLIIIVPGPDFYNCDEEYY